MIELLHCIYFDKELGLKCSKNKYENI